MPESPIHLILITLIYFCLLIALAQFAATRHRAILYYAGYLCGLAMHYTRDFLVYYAPESWRVHVPDLPLRWDSPTALFSHSMYLLFISVVLELPETRPRLNRLLVFSSFFFLALAVMHIFLQICFSYSSANKVYWVARVLFTPFSLFIILLFFITQAKAAYQKLVLLGSLVVVLSFPISMAVWFSWPLEVYISGFINYIPTHIGNIYLPYIKASLVLEILCFSWAMAFIIRESYSKPVVKGIPNETKSTDPLASVPSLESFPPAHPFAQNIVQFIESRLSDESLGVPDVCKFASLSNSQVTRKLKDICSLSTEQFIQRYRMHRAFEMLQAGDRRVGEVATAVGFKEVAYFSRVFKQTYGVNPSEVKKPLKSNKKPH